MACKVIHIWKYGLYQLQVQPKVTGMVRKLEWRGICLCPCNEATVMDCFTHEKNSHTTLLKNGDVYIR